MAATSFIDTGMVLAALRSSAPPAFSDHHASSDALQAKCVRRRPFPVAVADVDGDSGVKALGSGPEK
jgi:hypothetical protein